MVERRDGIAAAGHRNELASPGALRRVPGCRHRALVEGGELGARIAPSVPCVPGNFELRRASPTLMLVVDRSRSMLASFGDAGRTRYDVLVDADRQVGIRMTLTAPACPAAQTLPGEVRDAAKRVEGVAGAKVEIVFEPPWSMDLMTEAAKLQLEVENRSYRVATGELTAQIQSLKNVINDLVVRYNGVEIFHARMGSGISANPYLQFCTVAEASGDIEFAWVDDAGQRGAERATLTVV